MRDPWRRTTLTLGGIGLLAGSGCIQALRETARLESAADPGLQQAGHTHLEAAPLRPGTPPPGRASAVALPAGPQPVDVYIRQALVANPTVRAARFNVLALRHRIPQVTALEDPVVSNTIFPIPAVAPQYSLMGYMPYDALIAQQFPWFGTLQLRGCVAEADVKVALMELAAAELDVVEQVKLAYHDVAFNQRVLALLDENRTLAEDFQRLAAERLKSGTATQTDVLRAETALADIERERAATSLALDEARAELARLLNLPPESELAALTDAGPSGVAEPLDRLFQLAIASRPDLRGRLEAIRRDEVAVGLAQKRYYPSVTLGAVYQNMQKTNAMTPETANGMPNIGMFVGFNLPIYRKKLDAGVCEAQARVAADRALYEAERNQAHRDIRGLYARARSQQTILGLLRRTNLPNAEQALKLTASDFATGGVDYLSLLTAQRELLEIRLQIAQSETELARTVASLERAVGVALSEQPPVAPPAPLPMDPVPPASEGPAPFAEAAGSPAESEAAEAERPPVSPPPAASTETAPLEPSIEP